MLGIAGFATVAVPGPSTWSPCTATHALRRNMDPGSSHSNQLDSPSSSNVLRFWEDPIPDFDFPYTQNDPTSSAGHLHPPPFPSAGSSHGTCEPLDHLTDNCKLLGLDDKLEIGQGDNCYQSDFNNGLVIGDGNPSTSNVGHDINNPSLCWAPDGQLNCDGCQVLREVIHSNGMFLSNQFYWNPIQGENEHQTHN